MVDGVVDTEVVGVAVIAVDGAAAIAAATAGVVDITADTDPTTVDTMPDLTTADITITNLVI